MGSRVKKNGSAGEKSRNMGDGRELSNAKAPIPQNRTLRHAKTSRYIGVKLRGLKSISIGLRLWTADRKRATIAKFSSEEQAAIAHDLLRRLFLDEVPYLQLGAGKLNFWEDRALFSCPFKANGMEEFVRKVWDTSIMAKRFRELAAKALALVSISTARPCIW